MSWSFDKRGKPDDVRRSARESLHAQICAEPEEAIKHQVLNVLEKALNAYPDGVDVYVHAFGSQLINSDSPARAVNSLRIEITPITRE